MIVAGRATVNQDVSKRDCPRQIGDTGRGVRVNLAKLVERRPDDLELSLDSCLQLLVCTIVVKIFASDEAGDPLFGSRADDRPIVRVARAAGVPL